ncbi:MAG TPA: hypothetical protein VM370_13355 [Candidatus Thermoplasmatota archaeon]|nr:hypothetical protein [Candidatus Thermoplasmatota archaeon]
MPPVARKAKRSKPASKPQRGRKSSLKFRVEPERAAIVQRIAKQEGRTESDVLREGIDLLERVRARRENLSKLAEFIREIPPEFRARK